MARRVLMAKESGGWVRGRQRLGWMNGVKVALGNRGMTVEAACQCTKDRKEWRALVLWNWMSITKPFWPEWFDGRSQWGTGTRETEVMLDGWCEGGLRQQRNAGGGCATMSERSERAESSCTYVTEWVSSRHFCLALCSFGPPSRALVVITWRGEGCRYMMRLGYKL